MQTAEDLIRTVEEERERHEWSMRKVSIKAGWSHNAYHQMDQARSATLGKFVDICQALEIRVVLFDRNGRMLNP